jgi:putative heme-binding domain-containing protein
MATLAGISRGLFARVGSLVAPIPAGSPLPKHFSSRLTEIASSATSIAVDTNKSVDDRRMAIIIAANGDSADVERLVRETVHPSQPQVLQSAAVWVAAQANVPELWEELFSRWADHTTTTRAEMIAQSLQSTAGTDALVSALETDILSAQELSAVSRESLAQVHDESLRSRIQPILEAVIPTNRADVVARYADIDSRRGDSARGAAIFKQKCQTCHAVQGIGQKVGPDLTSVASRRTDLLVADILDPSHQVSPDYINYLLVTKDGRSLSGLIARETSESVTLRREEGQQDTIPRINIEQLSASGKSIMPDGLERDLSHGQLADLLQFLHNPDASLLDD